MLDKKKLHQTPLANVQGGRKWTPPVIVRLITGLVSDLKAAPYNEIAATLNLPMETLLKYGTKLGMLDDYPIKTAQFGLGWNDDLAVMSDCGYVYRNKKVDSTEVFLPGVSERLNHLDCVVLTAIYKNRKTMIDKDGLAEQWAIPVEAFALCCNKLEAYGYINGIRPQHPDCYLDDLMLEDSYQERMDKLRMVFQRQEEARRRSSIIFG